jgi:hypothetical protein
MSGRARAFAAIVTACLVAVVVVVVLAATRNKDSAVAELSQQAAPASSAPVGTIDPSTRMILRAVDPESPRLNGRLYRVQANGRSEKVPGAPACERVAVAGGRGICLYLAQTGVDYRAAILDRRMHVKRVLGLTGLPSRARVSPNGRVAGVTTFAYGDSYAAPGTFSTRTQVIDLVGGKVVADLEQWRFTLDGTPVTAVDRNFWGLSFGRDDDTFYATMATGDHHYLVRGSIKQRGGAVLRDDVECPSLSPDQTRVAYKFPLGKGRWRLHVYDLRTKADVALGEQRTIDDQPSWIDDQHVAYSDGKSTWIVPADGSGEPRLVLEGADSPTVITPAATAAPADS